MTLTKANEEIKIINGKTKTYQDKSKRKCRSDRSVCKFRTALEEELELSCTFRLLNIEALRLTTAHLAQTFVFIVFIISWQKAKVSQPRIEYRIFAQTQPVFGKDCLHITRGHNSGFQSMLCNRCKSITFLLSSTSSGLANVLHLKFTI